MKRVTLCFLILIAISVDSIAQNQKHHISFGNVHTFESPSLNGFYIGDVGFEIVELKTFGAFRASYGYEVFKWLVPEIGIENYKYSAGKVDAAYEPPVEIRNRSYFLGFRTQFNIVGVGLDFLLGKSWSTFSFNYMRYDGLQDYDTDGIGYYLGISPHYNLTNNLRLKTEARISGFGVNTDEFSDSRFDIDQFVTISLNLSLAVVFTL